MNKATRWLSQQTSRPKLVLDGKGSVRLLDDGTLSLCQERTVSQREALQIARWLIDLLEDSPVSLGDLCQMAEEKLNKWKLPTEIEEDKLCQI